MAKAGIKIENVHLSFGKTKVLKGVDLEIRPGEFFAFLGAVGFRKIHATRAIAGFGPTPKGRILIGERDVVGLNPWSRNRGNGSSRAMLVAAHVSARQCGIWSAGTPSTDCDAKRRVGEVLDLVGLAHLAERMPNQLSGGQQQRIALARTIVEPEVLLRRATIQPRCGLTRTDAQSCYVFNVSWV